MPPVVCVTQANAPPAKIKISPTIARVHLRCMTPSLCCPVPARSFVVGRVLISKESVSESKKKTSGGYNFPECDSDRQISPSGMCLAETSLRGVASLRANGSDKNPPEDRLREAIQTLSRRHSGARVSASYGARLRT